MEDELLKLNLLSIAVSGLIMLAAGLVLYAFRAGMAPYVRYVLPIPPLAVAAYVFVFNLFKTYAGRPPAAGDLMREVLVSTGLAAGLFLVFTALLIGVTLTLKRYF